MKIIQVDLNKDYSEVINEAVNILNYGGTIIYPTDTLYGLGANVLNEIAVRKVFRIKERSFSKPLPLIARNYAWVKELAEVSSKIHKTLEKIWPLGEGFGAKPGISVGKITAVLPKKDIVQNALTAETKTVGIRIH